MQSTLCVLAVHFLLHAIPTHKGLRHLWNAPPYSDAQQVWRLWRSALPQWACLGRKSKNSHPRAVSGPGPQRGPLWSLVSSRYDQEAVAGLLRSPPSSDMLRPDSLFPISRLPHWGGPLPLQLLKTQPCYVHLESCPQGPPGRSSAWVCL